MHSANTNLTEASSYKRSHYTEVIADLNAACLWLGLSGGRADHYHKLIREFWTGRPTTPEHIFAHNESFEVLDIFELWEKHIELYSGLKSKIADALREGPLLREGERPDKSNNNLSRNKAFEYLVAGKLLHAGINVIAVDGVLRDAVTCHTTGDSTFEWDGKLVDVQCKRPQSLQAVASLLKKARHQIARSSAQCIGGIIAIDCSAFVRPPGSLVQKPSAQLAAGFYLARMTGLIKNKVTRDFRPEVLGVYAFARAPAMTPIRQSLVLSVSGRPFVETRPESISVSTIFHNPGSRAPRLLQAVYDRLRQAF